MLGRLKNLTVNQDGTQKLTMTVQADFRETFDELFNSDVEINIKKFYKKRSLDANAKAWVMIDQLAEKLRIKKSEVYQNAIKDIGGVSTKVLVKNFAVETLCKNWQTKGEGWMAEPSPSSDPDCTVVTLYYGSSVYNTKQMADLIDFLVQSCNEQGIPTMTDEEVERCLFNWGKKHG